jgi:hypothetical protein
MFLIEIQAEAGRLASVAQTQGWRVTDNAADDVPHLIVVAPGVDVAAIRAGTTPRAAAPVILLAADVGSAPPPGIDDRVAPPTSDAAAGAILDRWRPDGLAALARIEVALGVESVRAMLLRLRHQLEAALDDAPPAETVLRAHRLGGIAGMLGFGALGEAWLAVESGVPGAAGAARIQTRRTLAAIARRLY